MTTDIDENTSSSNSEPINSLSAELTRLSLDKISFDKYLPRHAQILQKYIQPIGYIYYMRMGPQAIQRILHFHPETLQPYITLNRPSDSPFANTIHQVFQEGQTLTLTPQDRDANEAALKNPTPFQHYFSPFFINGQVFGVIHCWTEGAKDTTHLQFQTNLLGKATQALGTYLKSAQIDEMNIEAARLRTYTYLLDQLCGNFDLDTISLILVNYARETIGCERVCLFTPKTQLDLRAPNFMDQLATQPFCINAVSGLKKAHPRSELAVLLAQTAQHIVVQFFKKQQTSAMPYIIERYAQREDSQPDKEHLYFKVTAMNWATAIPLITRDMKICGLLLFEGRKTATTLATALMRLQGLIQAMGPVIESSLTWKKHWILRFVNSWVGFFKRNPKNARKQISIKTGIFLGVIAAISAFPLPYYITGEAILHPKEEIIIPAQRQAGVAKIFVRTGQYVRPGQKLLELDTQDIENQLRATQQEYYRTTAETNNAQLTGEEAKMHQFLADTNILETHIQRLEEDLQKSIFIAPFEGTVIGPANLNQLRGKIVQVGQELIKLASLHNWVIHTSVRQQDLILIEKYLSKHSKIQAKLNLLALPTETFPFEINTLDQFSFSTAGSLNEFTYYITAHITVDRAIGMALKDGYKGKTKIYLGWKPIAYQLFRDFKEYLQGRFFFD